jgi:hypothetical protein
MCRKFCILFYLIIAASSGNSKETDSLLIETGSLGINAVPINNCKPDLENMESADEKTSKGDDLHQKIADWGIAIIALILAVITIVAAVIGILIPLSIRKEIKEMETSKNKAEKETEELLKETKSKTEKLLKETEGRIEKLEERIHKKEKAKQKKYLEYKLLAPERMFFSEEDDADSEKKTEDDDIFFKLFEDYKQKKDNGKVLKKLKELLKDNEFENIYFRINYYIGYIYGDETNSKESIDFEEARRYYELSLEELCKSKGLEPRNRDAFKCIVLNDLAYTEMELSKTTKSEEKAALMEKAKNHLDESIDILSFWHLKWANPYKNKGSYFGKLAISQKDKSEQAELFVKALSMHQIAFSLYANATNEEALHKSYNQTLKDFISLLA